MDSTIKQPKLYILSLNWNGEEHLKTLYPTLMGCVQGLDYEWLVKDNGSKDKSVEYLHSLNDPKLRVIAYPDNKQNFSQGMNYLFNEAAPADNDYVMLLNNDIIFQDITSIKNMLTIMEKDKDVGVVGARLLYTNTDKIQHCGVVFNPTYKTPMHFRAGQKTDKDAEKNRLFQAITGAVMITKAEYFRNANKPTAKPNEYMNSDLHWAFCDIDLCLAIKYNLNKKIVYCGQTNIFHEESAALKKNPINKLYLKHNLTTFFNKWKDRYVIDQDIYTKNPNYNLYEAPNA
jgi:GT2 family glycosyltransferase